MGVLGELAATKLQLRCGRCQQSEVEEIKEGKGNKMDAPDIQRVLRPACGDGMKGKSRRGEKTELRHWEVKVASYRTRVGMVKRPVEGRPPSWKERKKLTQAGSDTDSQVAPVPVVSTVLLECSRRCRISRFEK